MDAGIDGAGLLSQVSSQTPKSVAKGADKAKMKETAEQFEALFIQQIYKEMRKTIPNDGYLPRGNADDILAQLQDMEAAKTTAAQGGIGLAELMLEQLMKDQ